MPIQLSGSLVITGSITTTGVITMSGSIASASYSSNSDLLQGTGSVGFATTASLNAVSSSQQQISSSQQQISASLLNVIAIGATTGSNSFRATQSITGSLTVTGQIIAQTINVQQVTSSIIYSSGSNIFGCDLNSRQTFTGSFYQTGSIAIFNATNTCFANDVHINGDLRMSGPDSFIWSPQGSCTGYTGFFDAYNSQIALMVCNNSGHLLLQPARCNVGIGTNNPTNKLTISNNGDAVVAFKINDTNANSTSLSLNASNTDTGIIAGGTCAVPIDLYTGNCVRMRISSTGNIGINNTCPANKLQICTTSATENVVSITNGTQNLQLGLNNEVCGSYLFEKSNSALRLGTADTERMRITDTGIACFACQVCIANNLVIAGAGIFINRPAASSGEPYIFLQKDGVTRGSIYGADGSAGLRYFGVSNCFEGIICAASGIKFSSGGSTLNVYETSTWTPFISRQSSAPTVSYSSREGTYTRIGNMIYVFWDINVSSISGGSGAGTICNLPYTVSNTMAGYSAGQYRDASLVAAVANTVLKGYAERGQNYIVLQNDYAGACGFGTCSASSFNASGRITGYVIYQV